MRTLNGVFLNVKGIQLYFDSIDDDPDFVSQGDGKHGRLETRKIWVTTRLNDYLNFPYVGQVFMIERNVIKKFGSSAISVGKFFYFKPPDSVWTARGFRCASVWIS